MTNVAKTEPGATAAVIGLGGVGLAVIQGLVLSGAATIIGIDPVAERRERATGLGATLAFDSAAADLPQRVLAATGRIGCDYVFDTVSSTKTTQVASGILRAGGKVVLIGVTGDPQPLGMSSMDLQMPEVRRWILFAIVIRSAIFRSISRSAAPGGRPEGAGDGDAAVGNQRCDVRSRAPARACAPCCQ